MFHGPSNRLARAPPDCDLYPDCDRHKVRHFGENFSRRTQSVPGLLLRHPGSDQKHKIKALQIGDLAAASGDFIGRWQFRRLPVL